MQLKGYSTHRLSPDRTPLHAGGQVLGRAGAGAGAGCAPAEPTVAPRVAFIAYPAPRLHGRGGAAAPLPEGWTARLSSGTAMLE